MAAKKKSSSARKTSSSGSTSRTSSKAYEATGDGADGVGSDNVIDASKVEQVPTDEKAGPRSVQSREIRPDEQNLPAGTSAFQEPAAA